LHLLVLVTYLFFFTFIPSFSCYIQHDLKSNNSFWFVLYIVFEVSIILNFTKYNLFLLVKKY